MGSWEQPTSIPKCTHECTIDFDKKTEKDIFLEAEFKSCGNRCVYLITSAKSTIHNNNNNMLIG